MHKQTDLTPSSPAIFMTCVGCEREVPLSEAVVPEASDYVAYFCGLDCYERWRNQAERSLVRSIR